MGFGHILWIGVDSRVMAWATFSNNENQRDIGQHLRFSKLRLTGFKSFVDPTDLIIADGLTGVVGPNG